MSKAADTTVFSFYGSDFEPEENDHLQEEIPLPNLDDAVAHARTLMAEWQCGAAEVVVDDELVAIVTADEVLAGEELERRLEEAEEDVWEVSFYGSNYEPGNDYFTETMELPSWEAVVAQAQALIEEWGAEYVDVRADENAVARVTREGAFLPEEAEDDESIFPEYDFYASDCNLTDPTNERMEMGLVFDDLDGAIDYARELMSGWGCEYVDVHEDEELVARVTADGVITDEELYGEDEGEAEDI